MHDAARPARDALDLFDAVIAAVRAGADAAVPALPVADTLKRVDGTRVVETVDRTDLVAVQTPQAFRAAALRAAHATAADATDDAALVEAAGGTVVVVPGDSRNLKITDRPTSPSRPRCSMPDARVRVGLGFDVHPFGDVTDARPLVLGGVHLDGPGLAGHSDADVVAHAVADALLGPCGPPRSRHACSRVRRPIPRRVVARAPARRGRERRRVRVGGLSTSTS